MGFKLSSHPYTFFLNLCVSCLLYDTITTLSTILIRSTDHAHFHFKNKWSVWTIIHLMGSHFIFKFIRLFNPTFPRVINFCESIFLARSVLLSYEWRSLFCNLRFYNTIELSLILPTFYLFILDASYFCCYFDKFVDVRNDSKQTDKNIVTNFRPFF